MINIRQSLTIGMLTFTGLGLFGGAALADTRGGGEGTVSEVTIDDDVTWDVLEFEPFDLASASNCIAVASSDVKNPFGTPTDQYEFVLSLDTTAPAADDVSQRRIELHNASDTDDPAFDEITSTRSWIAVPPGPHNVFWLGSKITADATTTDAIVDDSTLTLMCFDGPDL